ncbi:hypothetical protein ONZ45_g6276 [Pleurotus djamor]|nr:hypothetical protein ONZ45_g6276 [Pleurotus djamor]
MNSYYRRVKTVETSIGGPYYDEQHLEYKQGGQDFLEEKKSLKLTPPSRKHKKKRDKESKETSLRVINDAPDDQDMWVEKNIDMRVQCAFRSPNPYNSPLDPDAQVAYGVETRQDDVMDDFITGFDVRVGSQPASECPPSILGRERVSEPCSPKEKRPIPTDQLVPNSSHVDVEVAGSSRVLEGYEWTCAHSYFLLMGGFAVADPSYDSWIPISAHDVLNGKVPWPSVKEAAVLNGAKGESVAKIFLTLQVTWFVLHFFSRPFHHFVITELEFMTCGYATICLMMHLSWFRKPYDVQQPIIIPGSADMLSSFDPIHTTIEAKDFLSGRWVLKAHSQIVDDLSLCAHGPHFTCGFLITDAVMMGWYHVMGCVFYFGYPTRLELFWWLSSSICVSVLPPLYVLLILLGIRLFGNTPPRLAQKASAILVPILCNAYMLGFSWLMPLLFYDTYLHQLPKLSLGPHTFLTSRAEYLPCTLGDGPFSREEMVIPVKHKKKRDKQSKETSLRIINDDPDDQDMWVEKNIDMDGERSSSTSVLSDDDSLGTDKPRRPDPDKVAIRSQNSILYTEELGKLLETSASGPEDKDISYRACTEALIGLSSSSSKLSNGGSDLGLR